jgi:hypothetical protein
MLLAHPESGESLDRLAIQNVPELLEVDRHRIGGGRLPRALSTRSMIGSPTVTPNNMVPIILGHVLVHEITYILQGICRHSESRIMKARWELRDFADEDETSRVRR